MSKADEIFIQRCIQILFEGEYVEAHRAKWADGTPADTLHITNVVNEYDVGKEFPIGTIRKTGLKSLVQEILWIYQKKSNNIKDLGLHIWDQWADNTGSIGKAYGYQIGQPYVHHKVDMRKGHLGDSGFVYEDEYVDYPSYSLKEDDIDEGGNATNVMAYLDQMDGVLWDLRHDYTSRRIMTSTYNFTDLKDMGLYPCAYSCTYNVFDGKLNMILNQRSQDMLAASFWNVAQYAALLIMVAKATGLKPGKLTHVISDCHIYNRHINIIKELIERPVFDAPTVRFNSDSTDFYSYKPGDWSIENYTFGPQVSFEVAI